MNVDCVAGLQYGSEGKGAVTRALVARKKYGACVRSGGPNAGHTLYFEEEEFKMQQIPAGWVDPDCNLFLTPGAIINIDVLKNEMEAVAAAGRPVNNRLFIHENAMVVTRDDMNSEAGIKESIGSTGEGVGAARRRKMARWEATKLAKDYKDLKKFTMSRDKWVEWLQDHKEILLEGTQGAGLCLLNGAFPYVTSWPVSVAQLLADAGLPPQSLRDVFGVVRTMPIRVSGNSGPLRGETTWKELGFEPEHTTVTKKVRRIAKFIDYQELALAFAINRPTKICLTFGDYLIEGARKEVIQTLESKFGVPVVYVGMGKTEILCLGAPFLQESEREAAMKTEDKPGVRIVECVNEMSNTIADKSDDLVNEMLNTLVDKRKEYGTDNINVMGEISVLSRAMDKVFRIRNIMEQSEADVKFDSIYDAWKDLSAYGIIGMCMCKFGRW